MNKQGYFGIDARWAKDRRQALCRLADTQKARWLVIFSGEKKQKNADVHYPFRPSSSFYYLTGCCEPEACLVLKKEKDEKWRSYLFYEGYSALKARWEGDSHTVTDMLTLYEVDACLENTKLSKWFAECAKQSGTCYVLKEDEKRMDAQKVARIDQRMLDLWMTQLRLVKTDAEIHALQKACDTAVLAFQETIRSSVQENMQHEYEIEAFYTYACQKKGFASFPYPSIVASGEHATILHYTKNNAKMNKGTLILMDAGCEYQYYGADITRVWPISGRFTDVQKEVYQVVLDCQKAVIAAIKPGVRMLDLQNLCVHQLTNGLLQLGVLQGDVKTCMAEKTYLPYFMHRFGHMLGLDVHDVCLKGEALEHFVLEKGMVLTVEPGLYFSKNAQAVEDKWKGIGVRIEDDCLVTADGVLVLTGALEKEISEIEALCVGNA